MAPRLRRRSGTPALAASLTLLAAAAACGTGAPGAADAPVDQPAPVPDAPPIAVEEYAARRAALLDARPDGLVVLAARPVEKAMEQWGFVQAPAFQYFVGLPEVPGAIVVLDGPARETHLFLPTRVESFGAPVEGLVPEPGPATAAALGVTSARPWTEFRSFVEGRLGRGVSTLYVDEPRRPEPAGVPPGMPRVAGDRALWRASLEGAFPEASVRGVGSAVETLRAVKSDAEVALLEVNARRTVAALLAAARRLEPGVTQRRLEATVVAACLEAGGQGPSFWPWTMSGPNAHMDRLFGAFFRYDGGDRAARAGEVVRVDIGCAGGGYGADVGRTLPVSGAFDDGQAEAWNLLIDGYRAGLDAMADGVAVAEVRAASVAAVRARAPDLATPAGRAAADAILAGGDAVWHIHGVGVESGENLPDTLRAGMVLAYEPGFAAGPDAWYLEDMVLVTADGHRVLSSGLPYRADEIAAAMSTR